MRRGLLASFTLSLLAAACADTQTSNGDAQVAVDVVTADDRPSRPDVIDVHVAQPDVIDVPIARDAVDVPDVPVAMDVVDVVDAPDVPPAMDVIDVPVAPDVVDVSPALDVVDAPDVVDVPAAPDVVDAGPPPCDGGATRCGDTCVDVQSSNEHCGACGRRCCSGLFCNRGRCGPWDCPAGIYLCPAPQMPGVTCGFDLTCIDLRNDSRNCGMCGNACATGLFCAEGECVRRNPDGSFLPPSRAGAAGTMQVVATGLGGVQGLLLSQDASTVYVSATGLGVIWRARLFQVPAMAERWAEGLSGPSQMTFDPEGRIVVAEREGNRVTRIAINPDGSAGARTSLPVTFQGPWGVIFDGNGNLFVSNEFGNTVDRVSSMGTVTRGVVPMFPAPLDLRFDAAGNLYVGDYGNPLTSGTNVFVHDGALMRARTITGLLGPIGIALDLGGDVYVANYRGNNVARVSPSGASSVYAAGLSGPHAIAFDPRGTLYVADYGNQRLVRFPRR